MTQELTGKVAFITGGTTGIGYATARKLASLGASVAACTIDEASLARAPQTAAQEGFLLHAIRADVTKSGELAASIADTVDHFGGLDILVNCAGLVRFGDAVELSEEHWNQMLAVNLTGSFLAAKFAVPEMRKRGGGVIVNLSSVVALATGRRRLAYTASKAGVIGLTKTLALNHAREGIRVNAVCPGGVETEMLRETWASVKPDKSIDEMRRDADEGHPIGRIGQPDDIAELIAYLVSPRAAFLTGQAIVIDGGVSVQLAIGQAK